MADEPKDPPQDDTAAKLEEFRANNRKLFNENATLKAQMDELMQTVNSLKEAPEKAEVEKKTLADRIEALERSNKAKDEALAQERERTKASRIKDELVRHFSEQGDPKAARDAAALVADQFDLSETGQLLRRVNGEVQLSKERPGEPQDAAEFVSEFLIERPYFAGRSTGDNRRTGRTVNGKPAIDGRDPHALGRYAEQIANGEMEVYTE